MKKSKINPLPLRSKSFRSQEPQGLSEAGNEGKRNPNNHMDPVNKSRKPTKRNHRSTNGRGTSHLDWDWELAINNAGALW